MNDKIKMVTLVSKAGTGRHYSPSPRVFADDRGATVPARAGRRPISAGQDIGFLPGTVEENSALG